MLFPRPRLLPATRLPVVPPCLSEKKEARQDSRGPGQGSERANLMKLQTGTRPQFTVIGGHAVCETRRGTAAGYSVHMGIFTDHSRNGQVWAYTLGTTHVPRILPPLVTSFLVPSATAVPTEELQYGSKPTMAKRLAFQRPMNLQGGASDLPCQQTTRQKLHLHSTETEVDRTGSWAFIPSGPRK